MNTKNIGLIAALILIVTGFSTYLMASPEERQILKAMHNAGMSIPDYVKVENSSDTTHLITFGIGGRTCTSFVEIQDEKVTKEFGKTCN